MKIFTYLPSKSAKRKTLGGVVSGVAEFLGLPVGLSKVIVLILIIITGIIPGVIIYILAYLLMPNKDIAVHNHVITQSDVDEEMRIKDINDDSEEQ